MVAGLLYLTQYTPFVMGRGYLQDFQTALGWKLIKDSDVRKTYQQYGSLVDIVYTEVMRDLHYMHASSFVEKNRVQMNNIHPAKLALHLVVTFDKFLDDKLLTCSNKVLCMNISFSN